MPPLFSTDRPAGLLFVIACLAWLLFEVVLAIRDKALRTAATKDRYSGVVVFSGIWAAITAGFGFAYGAPQFTMIWERPLIFCAGVILILSGVAFRWYAVSVLGKYFTRQVAIQAGQGVVEAGPYRLIRHPAYTGTLITFLGLGLAMTNWLSLVFVPIFAGLGHGFRIWVEEQALSEGLGEPYRAYMRRTKRFIPYVY